MKTKKIWRLRESPTTNDIINLVEMKLITKEEANDILFTEQTEEDRDKKSLQSEIKFLRELVEKLSDRTKTVEIIREIQKPYHQFEWYKPYSGWCTAGATSITLTGSTATTLTNNAFVTTASGSGIYATTTGGNITTIPNGFSSIKTF